MSQAGMNSGMNSGMGMSSSAAPRATLSRLDDLRTMLAAQASRAEHRNRPRALVLGAIILLLLGAWYAWSGYRASASQADRALSAERQAKETLDAASRLQGLMQKDDRSGVRLGEQTSNLFSRIESLGSRAGLSKPVPIANSTPRNLPTLNLREVKVTYTLQDESLGAILAWANLVTEDVPGMFCHSVTIRPLANEWTVTVVFVRWERAEGQG
jgi:hypothetical protein